MPPRRDHGATPDFRLSYILCRILHFLPQIKKVKSDLHVFTVKVYENGDFWPPEDAFWGPLGELFARPKC